MEAPGYLIAAALKGIIPQRLAKRVCSSCSEPVDLSAGEMAWLRAQDVPESVKTAQFRQGRGCKYCNLTGYQGRIGVYELLEMDDGLTDALRREDLSAFMKLAELKKSYVPLERCALHYAAEGTTSFAEVIRLVGSADLEVDRYSEDVVTELAVSDDINHG